MVGGMLKVLSVFPLHIFSAIAYVGIAMSYGVSWFDQSVMVMTLPSGAPISVTGGDVAIIWAVLFLLIETIKASQTDWISIANHGLSSMLFMASFAVWLTLPMFGTTVWLIITSMMFVDMMAGWAVTAFSARRDFGFGG